ncbi:MAG: hypothetical protein ACFFEX_17285 [Candidatus Thorarchaeota archaeon]
MEEVSNGQSLLSKHELGFNYVLYGFSNAAIFLTNAVIALRYPLGVFGAFAVVIGYAQIASAFSTLGLGFTAVRYIPSNREYARFFRLRGALLIAIASVAAILLGFVTMPVVGIPEEFYPTVFVTFPMAFISYGANFAKANERPLLSNATIGSGYYAICGYESLQFLLGVSPNAQILIIETMTSFALGLAIAFALLVRLGTYKSSGILDPRQLTRDTASFLGINGSMVFSQQFGVIAIGMIQALEASAVLRILTILSMPFTGLVAAYSSIMTPRFKSRNIHYRKLVPQVAALAILSAAGYLAFSQVAPFILGVEPGVENVLLYCVIVAANSIVLPSIILTYSAKLGTQSIALTIVNLLIFPLLILSLGTTLQLVGVVMAMVAASVIRLLVESYLATRTLREEAWFLNEDGGQTYG